MVMSSGDSRVQWQRQTALVLSIFIAFMTRQLHCGQVGPSVVFNTTKFAVTVQYVGIWDWVMLGQYCLWYFGLRIKQPTYVSSR